MKKKHNLLIVILLSLFILGSMMGCKVTTKRLVPSPAPTSGSTPSVQVQPKELKPAIPQKINKGAEKEPNLKVYDVESKTIKQLPLEKYIEGVVAGEIKNDWPTQALEAQAILARTFVLGFIDEKGGSKYKGADISTDIEEAQAWNMKDVNDKIRTAVKKTRGMVMSYKGKYPDTWFHSNAGGITATAKEGLNYKKPEPPYIMSKQSPDSPEAPPDEKKWNAVFPKDQFIKALKDVGCNVDKIKSIKIGQKGPSGRAIELLINDKKVSAPDLRLALGSQKMKSTLLDKITLDPNKILMQGRGYGHGVGMSQWGAYVMAKQGKSAVDIIQFYFKDIQLVKVWK